MSAHTHDDIDWLDKVPSMHRVDELERDARGAVAARLLGWVRDQPVVVDVGSGTGGMSAALTGTLAGGQGGTVVLVDAVPELLELAGDAARARAGNDGVRVDTVVADLHAADLVELVPPADLLWASGVVHHLPDQQGAIARLASVLRGGGLLAVAEGGLETLCLPWDLGVGEPGLEQRLVAARAAWFQRLRAAMPGAVSMPYGWTVALRNAGLSDVGSFSFLVEHPAPADDAVRDHALERLRWLGEAAGEWLSVQDRDAVERLVDPDSPDNLGNRSDIYLLSTRTVHYGWAR